MSRRMMAVLPAVVLLVGLAVPTAGQEKLAEGTWTGNVFVPTGEVYDMEYVVSYGEAGALSIELIPPPEVGTNIMANDPVFEAETLVFTIDVGQVISCNLAAQEDGSLEGECIDSTGEPAVMSMIPPS